MYPAPACGAVRILCLTALLMLSACPPPAAPPPPGARDVWKVTAWGPAAPSTEDDEVDGAEPGAPRLFSTTAPDAPRAEHP